jgi:hypothetical protein
LLLDVLTYELIAHMAWKDGSQRHECLSPRRGPGSRRLNDIDCKGPPSGLGRLRRLEAQELVTRIRNLVAPTRSNRIQPGSGRGLGAITQRLHPFGSLKPTFAAALRAIDPAQASRRCLARLQQALPLSGTLCRSFVWSRLTKQSGEWI